MKHVAALPLIGFLASLALSSGISLATDNVIMEYFYVNPAKFGYCPTCYDPTIDRIIGEIEIKYGSQISVERIDVTTRIGGERLRNYSLTGVGVPVAVINHEYVVPKEKLTFDYLDSLISQILGGTPPPPSDNVGSVQLTLPLVVVSGLVDGINPCAFALLVFFLSYLFSVQRSRARVLAMGAVYILGLFATYLAIGLGLLQGVSLFGIEHFFGFVGVALMIAFGVLTIVDYVAPGKFPIKFPSIAVPRFKSIVMKATIPAALLLGVFVGLCEFPCTGAIYGGIIAYLASETTISGVAYLVLYNLVFVLPLIVILLFASNVKTLTKIDSWRLERRRQIKLFSGVFMVVLALLILFWLIS